MSKIGDSFTYKHVCPHYWPTVGRVCGWPNSLRCVVCRHLSSATHVLWLDGRSYTGKLITRLISSVQNFGCKISKI